MFHGLITAQKEKFLYNDMPQTLNIAHTFENPAFSLHW